jgi:hypothetical protein
MAALLAGCGQQSPPPDEETASAPPAEAAAPAEAATPASFEMTADLETKLAGADRMDGEEDKVVSRCPGCGLAMSGSDEHAMHVGDYSLHFCSEDCKGKFSEDLAESVLAMAIPEEEPEQP